MVNQATNSVSLCSSLNSKRSSFVNELSRDQFNHSHNDLNFESVSSSIRSIRGRPTYHVFEYRSTRILYDLMTGSLIELDPATYSILQSIELGLDYLTARSNLLRLSPNAVWDQTLDRVVSLRELGLFTSEKVESSSRGVAALMGHNPRKMMLMVQSNCNLKCSYCYEVLSGFHKTG